MLDRVTNELYRDAQNKDTVGERRQWLGAAKAEGKARAWLARRDPHRVQADRECEDGHEEMKGVRLEDVGGRDLRPDQLDDEECADEEQNDEQTDRLPSLRAGHRPRRGGGLLGCVSHQTRS